MNPHENLSPPQVQGFAGLAAQLANHISTVVLGKPQVVKLALTALFAQGHVLLEDVPGVGKTTLARAIAATVRGQWRRIQFTPDLLPSDVTGVTIYNQSTRGFEFHPGPVFANIVIADEINRASPKTQSALLEVMEEHTVTVDGVRHGVPRPFLVVATQNPVEMDGTYRLPEAQLDRFLMKLSVGYPDEAVEIEVLRGATVRSPEALEAITETATIGEMVRYAQRVHIAEPLYAYAVRLAAATRRHPQVRVGVSPRGVIALTRAACAYALTEGRGYILPEDLKTLLEPVFAHRILLSPDAQLRGVAAADVLREAVESVAVPLPASHASAPAKPPATQHPPATNHAAANQPAAGQHAPAGQQSPGIPAQHAPGGAHGAAAPHQPAPHQPAPHQAAPHQAAPHQAAPHQAAPHQAAPHQAAPHQAGAQHPGTAQHPVGGQRPVNGGQHPVPGQYGTPVPPGQPSSAGV